MARAQTESNWLAVSVPYAGMTRIKFYGLTLRVSQPFGTPTVRMMLTTARAARKGPRMVHSRRSTMAARAAKPNR